MSDAVTNALARLRRQERDAQEKMETLRRIPARDDFEHLTVVRVTVRPRYGTTDDVLTYVMLKIIAPNTTYNDHRLEHRWYFTGALYGRNRNQLNNGPAGPHMRWDNFVSWLVDDVEVLAFEVMTPATPTNTASTAPTMEQEYAGYEAETERRLSEGNVPMYDDRA